MSTRSRIGILEADGTITSIYCHSDGYPEGVGRTLLESWDDPAALRALLSLGDLSILGEEIGEKHSFDERYESADPRARWTRAYGRDRGEQGVEARRHSRTDWPDSSWEYLYLLTPDGYIISWDGKKWKALTRMERRQGVKVRVTVDDALVFDSADPQPLQAVRAISRAYANLNDDEQAQFFEEVGKVFEGWEGMAGDRQAYAIGRHMATCGCVTPAGRALLRAIVRAMDHAS